MYIRQIKRRNEPYDNEFIAHRLVESYRTDKGPRQLVLLDLGTLTIPREQWKMLTDTIEAKLSGQKRLFRVNKED